MMTKLSRRKKSRTSRRPRIVQTIKKRILSISAIMTKILQNPASCKKSNLHRKRLDPQALFPMEIYLKIAGLMAA